MGDTTTENVIVKVDVQGEEPLITKMSNLKAVMVGLREEQLAMNRSFKAGHVDRKELADDFVRTELMLKNTTKEFNNLKNASNAAKGTLKEVDTAVKETNTGFLSFSTILKSVGTYMAAQFSVQAFITGIKDAIGIVSGFEHQMNVVKALTMEDESAFSILEDQALSMAKSTIYSAQEIAKLMEIYSKLGFSAQEITKVTAATLELAQATGEDLSKSATIAGSTLRGFNLDAAEMQRVVDVMSNSFNKSALDLDSFGEAMKYVAPVANNANISLEVTAKMLEILSNAGIRGSMAGTSLRKMITDLAHGDINVFIEKLKTMSTNGYTTAQALDEVGRTAQTTAIVISNHTEEVIAAYEATEDLSGSTAKLAKVMSDDLAGDWERFKRSIENWILDSKGPLSTALRTLTQEASAFFNVLGADNLNITEKFAFLITGNNKLGASVDSVRQKEIDTEKVRKANFIEQKARAIITQNKIEEYTWSIHDTADKEAVLAEIKRQQDEQAIQDAKDKDAAIKESAKVRQAEEERLIELEKQYKVDFKVWEKQQNEIEKTEKETARIAKIAQDDKDWHDKIAAEHAHAEELNAMTMEGVQFEEDAKEQVATTEEAIRLSNKAKRKADLEDWKDNWMQYAGIILNAAGDFEKKLTDAKLAQYEIQKNALDAKLNDETKKLNTVFDNDKLALDKKLKDGIISQAEYDQKLEDLRKDNADKLKTFQATQASERYELKKKEFEVLKKSQISQAAIIGAQSAISAFASLAVIPGIGVALGLAAASAALTFTALQIANIKKTEFDGGEAPSSGGPNIGASTTTGGYGTQGSGTGTDGQQHDYYENYGEQGGQMRKFKGGGWFTIGGRRHSAGGTKFYGEDGSRFEAESDEGLFILKREAHKDFLKEQSSRNMRFGGRSWQSGGVSHAAAGGSISGGGLSPEVLAQAMRSVLSSLPRPVVFVSDINEGQNTVEVVEGKSTLLD